MELCLVIRGSHDMRPRRYPLDAGHRWEAGRYTHLGGPLVEGRYLRTQGPLLDAQEYMPLEPDPAINRYHLAVWRDESGAWVSDLNSRNGTRLNGVLLRSHVPHPLRADDIIEAANCQVLVAAAVPVEPQWLAQSGAVRGLARAAEAGNWATLPLLADALEDAGCADAELLEHLRGPHSGACSVVGLLLGRF